eukprot:CFRG4974T1
MTRGKKQEKSFYQRLQDDEETTDGDGISNADIEMSEQDRFVGESVQTQYTVDEVEDSESFGYSEHDQPENRLVMELDEDEYERQEMDILLQGERLRQRRRRTTRLVYVSTLLCIGMSVLVFLVHGIFLAILYTNIARVPNHNTSPEECCGFYDYTVQTVVNTDDVRGHVHLYSWYFPGLNNSNDVVHNPSRNMQCLLISHDLGTNMANYDFKSGSASMISKYVRPFVNSGLNVLLWDKRNHGSSEHVPPISFGLYEQSDVHAMIEWVLENHPGACANSKVAVLGEGFGAAEALMASATDNRIAAVISDSSYLNGRIALSEQVHYYWYLEYIPEFWLSYFAWCIELVAGFSFEDLQIDRIVGNTTTPILLTQGTRDTQTKFSNSKLLFEYVSGNRSADSVTEWFPYVQQHGDGYLVHGYFDRLLKFLDTQLGVEPLPSKNGTEVSDMGTQPKMFEKGTGFEEGTGVAESQGERRKRSNRSQD